MKTSTLPFLLIISTVALASACDDKKLGQTQYQEKPRIVKTQIITTFDGLIERHITGKLQAADTTSLSFEVKGIVNKVYINPGEAFTKGDLLAELDSESYTLTVNQQLISIEKAKASKAEAKQNLDHKLLSKKQRMVSKAEIDNSQAAFDIANERVNTALLALETAKMNVADTKLYAPYDGTLSQRLIEPSQQIGPQTSAFIIQGHAILEVSATLPESLIGRIELGEDAKVKIPALNTKQQYLANLTEIGSQASVANAFPITVTFTKAYPHLLAGMSAEVLLPIRDFLEKDLEAYSEKTQPLYEIPLSAIASDENGQYIQIVKVKEDNYHVQQHYIHISQILAHSILTRIDRNADEELEVVTAGVAFISNQQQVMPINRIQQIYNQ